MTTTQRDALSPTGGEVIFNSTANEVQGYNGSAWIALDQTGGGGEANTGANVGSGAGVFKDKTGTTINLKSVIGEANKIVITANTNDLTLTLGSLTVTTDKANAFGDFDQTLKDNRLKINNPADTFAYTIVAAAITAARTLNLPLLTANDTIAVLALAQTLTNKTINADNNTISNIGLSESKSELKKESLIIPVSDETTALTTGTAKVTFRMPYALTLTEVRASVSTAPTGSVLTVDINEGGTSILSTKLTIDAGEKTSETAATAAVISDTALADDAEITIDIDGVGSTVAGAGLKVTLIGDKT